MRSLVNKLSSFQSYVYSSNFSIICLTETWLSDHVYNNEILPSDFVLYRKDRASRGGGVLVAVKKSLSSSVFSSPLELEVVTVKLGSKQECILCCVYVPPNSSETYLSSLLTYLTDLQFSFKRCIFVGDFNFPDIDWLSLTGSSPLSSIFCEFIFDCNLTQHILEPTHVKGNTLDLIITSGDVSVENLSLQPPSLSLFPSADHFIISFSFQSVVMCPSKALLGYVFDYRRADLDGICSYLMDSDFSFCFQCNDIEFMWFTIKSLIYDAMSIFIPKIHVRTHQGPKWFTSDIRHHLKCLRSLRKRFKSRPTQHVSLKIRDYEDLLQLKMAHAKAFFEKKLIDTLESGQSSAIFSYIRSSTAFNSLPQVMSLDNFVSESDDEKARLFNKYFQSVFTKCSFHLPPISDLPTPQSCIGQITITESEVYQNLASLDPHKAMGCDEISPKVLKHCALPLYQPLHRLFSLCLAQNFVPLEWRTHLIKPIFKSGDRNNIRNYRPISLLCVVSKILERIVYNHLIDFVNTSVSNHQFGFLRKRSTLQQLLILTNTIADSLNRNVQTDVVYLDFRKAFDSVAHNELLYKLWSFGITDSMWSWFRAYLSGRMQCVYINSALSDFSQSSQVCPKAVFLVRCCS